MHGSAAPGGASNLSAGADPYAMYQVYSMGPPQPPTMFGIPTGFTGTAPGFHNPMAAHHHHHHSAAMATMLGAAGPVGFGGFPVNGGPSTPSASAYGAEYEVHDNQLKAPVAVHPTSVIRTVGSDRLFSVPPQPIVYGSRNVLRICDAFQEGHCAAGEQCHDVHVNPESLAAVRQQLQGWLTDRELEFKQTRQTTPGRVFPIFVADLKEVVEVPISALTFTKGLYVDPSARAKRVRGNSHPQLPTACGLFATDPTHCKWGRWCNQVHIDPEWMRQRKAVFESWSTDLENQFMSFDPDYVFTVHDPQLKVGLKLPKYSIASFSRGLFQGSNKKAPSVCLLYQNDRCRAGACCNQIHVVPEYLTLARQMLTDEQDPASNPARHSQLAAQVDQLRAKLIERQRVEREQHMAEVQQMQQQQPASQYPQSPSSRPAPQPVARGGPFSNGGSGGSPPPPPVTGYPYGASDTFNLDDHNLTGGLIEHLEVDDDVENTAMGRSAVGYETHYAGGSLTGMNSSRSVRVLNAGGHSYTNNPYCSVSSIPDAQVSHPAQNIIGVGSRLNAGIAIGGVVNSGGSDPQNRSSTFPRTPAASTTAPVVPGHRTRPVQVLSSSSMGEEELFSAPFLGSSGSFGNVHGADGSVNVYPRGSSTSQLGQSSTTALREGLPRDDFPRRRDARGWHPSVYPTGPDFDASLYFSPSPLLNAANSTTSAMRQSTTKDELGDADNSINFTAMGSVTHRGGLSVPPPQQQQQLSPGQQGSRVRLDGSRTTYPMSRFNPNFSDSNPMGESASSATAMNTSGYNQGRSQKPESVPRGAPPTTQQQQINEGYAHP